MTKICTKCLRELPLDQFGKHRITKDGLAHVCKECNRARVAEYKRLNPDKVKATKASQRAKDGAKAEASAYHATWRAGNADRIKANRVRYYEENVVDIRARTALWQGENRDRVQAYNAAWYVENAERVAVYAAQWRADNPDKCSAASYRRRAREANAFIGPIPDDIKAQLIAFYGPTCMVPDCESTDLTLDHVIPLNRGGAHAVANFQLLCKSCNSRKGDRSSADYRPCLFN